MYTTSHTPWKQGSQRVTACQPTFPYTSDKFVTAGLLQRKSRSMLRPQFLCLHSLFPSLSRLFRNLLLYLHSTSLPLSLLIYFPLSSCNISSLALFSSLCVSSALLASPCIILPLFLLFLRLSSRILSKISLPVLSWCCICIQRATGHDRDE